MMACAFLPSEYGIHSQPMTVLRGMERLRIMPSPYHDHALIDRLAEALRDISVRGFVRRSRRAQTAGFIRL
jgi:5-aminolevulinate synthase